MRVAPPATTGHYRRPGMTLIEVLLGLAILLLALVGIIQLMDVGTTSALEAAYQTDGTRLAQSKLAEVEAGAISPSAGGSGTFDDEPQWSWTATSEAASVPNLYTITVTVSRDLRGKPVTVTLSQMIFDPLQMGTASEVVKPTTTTSTTSTTTGTSK